MVYRSLHAVVAFAWVLLVGSPVALPQDAGAKPDAKSQSGAIVSALEKIQKEFAKHSEKEKEMQDKYSAIESRLKKTEEELRNINVQGMQQQLAAMQASIQAMQVNAGLRTLASGTPGNPGGNPNTGNGSNNNVVRDFAQMQLMQNRFLQNLDATLRANDLRQLDANAQATVRRRIETIQASVQLQQEWLNWQNETSQFYGRYWPWSDPEARYSRAELEAALGVLEKGHDNDISAKLAASNLLARSGMHAQALTLIEEILAQPTHLQGVATMEKAKILALLDKDKESKRALQDAIKLDKGNPYLRWIRAEIALQQNQDAVAETEWRYLTTIKSMEKEARRSLVMVHANRSKKSPGEGTKAIKEAKTAMELESVPDWYSHFIMATAYGAGRKWDAANESIDQAIAMADEEQKERCEKLKQDWEGLKQ